MIKWILKRVSCRCASDCRLNDEIKELKGFVKNLALDELREIKEYFMMREEVIKEKTKEIMRTKISTI